MADVYAVMADYHVGHPAILPKKRFHDLVVEAGGVGAGTVIRFVATSGNTTMPMHATVSEPHRGRVLQETYDQPAGWITTFTFEPLEGSTKTSLTLATELPPSAGIKGWIEQLLYPPVFRRAYKEELQLINEYMKAQVGVRA